ncbi:MAG: hypothetical protein ILA02_06280 [Clostridia bacterium]|nr:hypothetical protein [Clostridia bacterium]
MLKDYESFVILLCKDDSKGKIIDTVQKISLRKQIKYNRIKLKGNVEYSYILYAEAKDKQYIFDMARNKKLTILWKDEEFFGIISFKNSTKGDTISYLQNENNNGEKIEGEIIYLNLKKEFTGLKKVMLISTQQLDEENPYTYEHFCFYKRKNE